MIRDVTDLEVYNQSLVLLRKLYSLLRKIPLTEKDTVYQCKKCGKGIPAHIAEGFAKRNSGAEFKRFLKIGIGTSDELVTHLRALGIAIPRLEAECLALAEEYKVLSKRLNSLQSKWRSGELK